MHEITSTDEFDALLDAPVAVVFKHSGRCPISAMAMGEMEQLLRQRPDAPVHVIDVIDARAVSRHAAEQLAVAHHSPQAIVLVDGVVAWTGSHFDVRAETIARRLQLVDDAAPQRRAS